MMEESKDERIEEYAHEVEGPRRLSESILWEQMRRFYASQGVEAWSKGIVPFFITTNALIARHYAKNIQAYVNDLYQRAALAFNEPVYIVELGAGSGKFSFLVLKALMERLELCYGDCMPFRIKYIMTDFCDSPFKFWKEHGALKRYLHSGVLDFAKFDAANDDIIKLCMSRQEITLNSLKNPMIVIANYLFDTLPADSYRIKNGEILQGHISVYSKQPEKDPGDPTILTRFKPKFDWVPHVPGEQDPVVDEILEWYRSHFEKRDTSFLIPVASLSCLERLRKFNTKGKLMVLSGDKGISNTIGFQHGEANADPHIAVHGSFSLMVNYHSIGLWFDAKGGFALHSSQQDASLKSAILVVDGDEENKKEFLTEIRTDHWNGDGDPEPSRLRKFPGLRTSFHETIGRFGPDHFFHLQQHDFVLNKKNNNNNEKEEHLKSILALLQLSDWDSDLAFKFRETILAGTFTSNARLLDDLKRGMERAWENYFLLEPEKDFAFELGRFYYGLQEYERALIFFAKSTEHIGKHHITEHNIGLCHSHLGNKTLALSHFENSLELNPSYEKALEQRDTLRRQLRLPPIINTVLVEDPIAGKSPLNSPKLRNSPHVRVSIDPEVYSRYKNRTCTN